MKARSSTRDAVRFFRVCLSIVVHGSCLALWASASQATTTAKSPNFADEALTQAVLEHNAYSRDILELWLAAFPNAPSLESVDALIEASEVGHKTLEGTALWHDGDGGNRLSVSAAVRLWNLGHDELWIGNTFPETDVVDLELSGMFPLTEDGPSSYLAVKFAYLRPSSRFYSGAESVQGDPIENREQKVRESRLLGQTALIGLPFDFEIDFDAIGQSQLGLMQRWHTISPQFFLRSRVGLHRRQHPNYELVDGSDQGSYTLDPKASDHLWRQFTAHHQIDEPGGDTWVGQAEVANPRMAPMTSVIDRMSTHHRLSPPARRVLMLMRRSVEHIGR